MVEGVDSWLEQGSYLGIMLGMMLTGLGLPIPEEVFVIGAGLAAYHGALKSPWLALGACLVGALVGDLITYGIGRHFGRNVVRDHPLISKHLTPDRERHFEQLIRRHGMKVFFVSRFLVGVRSGVYLTAGILRFPLVSFLLIDAVCASSVVGLFFGLSYFFGDHIERWWHWIRQAEFALTALALGVLLLVGAFLWWKQRRRIVTAEDVLLDRALGEKAELNAAAPGETAKEPQSV